MRSARGRGAGPRPAQESHRGLRDETRGLIRKAINSKKLVEARDALLRDLK